MSKIIDIIGGLVKLGVNITSKQQAYLKWRMSDEGRKQFTKREENEFYTALAEGNTDMLDTRIKETQNEINSLRKRLGFFALLILCSVGCLRTASFSDPIHLLPSALMESELSYAVENIEITTSSGPKTLKGTWYIVSTDAMKMNRRNQKDLLESLKLLKIERKYRYAAVFVAMLVIVVYILTKILAI